MTVGKPHSLDYQVPVGLSRQAVGHTQPQGQCAVVGHGGHAELATRRLIPAPQDEELVAASILPIPEPLLVAGVAVGLEIVLLPPQPRRPAAQPHSARSNVGFQLRQPVPQIGQPPFPLMNLIKSATFGGIGDLLLCPCNPPPQAV